MRTEDRQISGTKVLQNLKLVVLKYYDTCGLVPPLFGELLDVPPARNLEIHVILSQQLELLRRYDPRSAVGISRSTATA